MSADKQEAPAAAPTPAKSNAMLMIVIAVMGTLLLAGGVGAALMLRGGDHEADEESVEATAEEGGKAKSDTKKKGSKSKEKKGVPKAAAIYIPLEPPFVVNFPAGPGPRYLQITVEVMTREPGAAQVVKDNNPLLRNDLLQLFASQAQETVAKPEFREALRNQALETVRSVVRAEGGKPDLIEA